MKTSILKTSLDFLYYSGLSGALSHGLRGRGAIFMLHHICPGGGCQSGFAPNSILEITPEFLKAAIGYVRERGYETVSLGEAVRRLESRERSAKPFAVFTIDDGYRDNLTHGLPVFQAENCPFTIFIAPAISDGTCELWWDGLEMAIARNNKVVTRFDDQVIQHTTANDDEKQAAWQALYWRVRKLGEHAQRTWIRAFCDEHGVDLDAHCRAVAMAWDEVRTIASEPLCTIGAHTINHFALARLSAEDALAEAVQSRARIARELGRAPEFFAYPYGDETSAGVRDFEMIANAGFRAAVTTRKGVVYDGHADHLCALPRVSLNGDYQDLKYLHVLMSGTAFALWNKLRRMNVG